MDLTSAVVEAIRVKASAHSIEPALVAAFVAGESSGNPFRTRYEPGWITFLDIKAWAFRSGITQMTEKIGQAHSWGLMQVMGTVARELGFQGLFPELCQPEIGLEFGCLELWRLARKFKIQQDGVLTWHEGLACAFNAGHPEMDDQGRWVVQGYVDRIEGHYLYFEKQGL